MDAETVNYLCSNCAFPRIIRTDNYLVCNNCLCVWKLCFPAYSNEYFVNIKAFSYAYQQSKPLQAYICKSVRIEINKDEDAVKPEELARFVKEISSVRSLRTGLALKK